MVGLKGLGSNKNRASTGVTGSGEHNHSSLGINFQLCSPHSIQMHSVRDLAGLTGCDAGSHIGEEMALVDYTCLNSAHGSARRFGTR